MNARTFALIYGLVMMVIGFFILGFGIVSPNHNPIIFVAAGIWGGTGLMLLSKV